RTDAYFGVDRTSISGGSALVLDAASGARSRTGITVGVRHRF
ncbi:MAG: porin, partial [Acidovorax sp.]|nr:porin [Acidovorax sp.]